MGEVVQLQLQALSDFERFWSAYPRRVAKKAARTAFEKAQRDEDWPGIDAVLAAVEAYKRHKPDYCDFCHASTWLNQGRWMDEHQSDTGQPTADERAVEFLRREGVPRGSWLTARTADEVTYSGRRIVKPRELRHARFPDVMP